MSRREVPCGSCTSCCHHELIILHLDEGDRPSGFRTRRVLNPITGKRVFALQQTPTGACTYLGNHGCTIHHRAPVICRSFDCRRLLSALTKELPAPQLLDAVLANPVLQAACRLLASSGERPVSLPLTHPDAPAVAAAGVSAPRAARSRHPRSGSGARGQAGDTAHD